MFGFKLEFKSICVLLKHYDLWSKIKTFYSLYPIQVTDSKPQSIEQYYLSPNEVGVTFTTKSYKFNCIHHLKKLSFTWAKENNYSGYNLHALKRSLNSIANIIINTMTSSFCPKTFQQERIFLFSTKI